MRAFSTVRYYTNLVLLSVLLNTYLACAVQHYACTISQLLPLAVQVALQLADDRVLMLHYVHL
jgi:hypothetical protein